MRLSLAVKEQKYFLNLTLVQDIRPLALSMSNLIYTDKTINALKIKCLSTFLHFFPGLDL